MSASRSYAFGAFVLDLRRGALLNAGTEVRLRPKSFEVLRFLVERHGQLVTKDELLDGVWGRTVVTEGSITQCLIDVRRAIGDESQRIVRTVPRRGYIFDVPVAEVDGTTDDASRVEAAQVAVHSTPVIGPPARHGRWALAIAVLAVFLVLTILGLRVRDSQGRREIVDSSAGSSIAVLPFVDMSAARDQQYLSDGITEEILDRLAKTGQFRVIARTSSFAFRDRSVDIPQIAAVLDVTHVLEGSVRRAGDRVRVTAQLVDTASNSHVWSDTYDRNLGDLFAVQEEIAASVAAALQTRLSSTGSGRPPSASGAAYERFLQGQYFVNRRAPGDVERAIRDYEEAVAIDPGFARAWAALSGAYGLLAWESDPPDPWRARQFESARQAVRLDPGLVEGHVRLAKYYFEVSQLDESLQAVREAAALAPDDPWLAGFSDGFPDWTNSDAEAEVASERRRVELDPLSATARKDLGLRLFAAGRLDEASSEFRKALELSPNLGWDAQIEISRVLVAQGRYDDASLEIAQLPPGEPRDYGLALLCEDPGRRADAEAALGRLAARSGDFMHDLRLAELLVLRGRIDDAFVRLQSARDGLPRDQSLLARIWYLQNEMHVSPFLQPLHADPRWAALMANPG